MKITRDNYEIYFLDYLEGNLDNELVDNFIDFLIQNPDLKEELQMADAIKLEADSIYFERKETLLKEKYDLPENFNDAAIALVEGDLSEKEKADFEAYLSAHPSKQNEMELFEKTKLHADKGIVFRKKGRLYHSGQEKSNLLWITRIAAVIAIAFLFYCIGGDITPKKLTIDDQVTNFRSRKDVPELIKIPESSVKKDVPFSVSEKIQVAERERESKVQPEQSIHESNKTPMNQEDSTGERISAEVPGKMPSLYACLKPDAELYANLIPMVPGINELPDPVNEERLLGDIVREKSGLDNQSVRKVARAGLGLISSISGKKFNYQTNHDGQITKLNYDSRLLAFTIPTKQVK